MDANGGWRDEDGHEDDDPDYNLERYDASESDAEVEQQEEEDDGELAREAVDTALAWIARVRERERARERAEALADQLAEADAGDDDDDADEHSGPFGRGMQWFHLPHLQGTPAARRGHSATLVPYSVLCGAASASTEPLSPLPTTTVTTTTRTASLDFMSLIERQICEEQRAKRDWAMIAECAAARQWKRRRREMAEDEVERVSRQVRCGDRVVVFGGNHMRTYMNDLHVLDVEFEGKPVLRWHAIARQDDGDHVTGKWPAPRAHHTATLVDQTIWIFGGVSSLAFRDEMSDVWALNLCSGEWSCPQLSEPLRPAARHGHTAIAVGEKIVVYGGTNILGTFFDDVWEFDTILLCWRRVNARLAGAARGAATTDADAPERPAGRYFHSATYIGLGKMVVHGGRSADEVFRDVLVLDLETELWHVKTSRAGDDGEIKPRAGHTASLLSSALVSSPRASYKLQLVARIVVYGGWDGSVDQHLQETGALGDVAVLSVVCEEDMGSFSAAWIKCDTMICGSRPTDRDCHTAVVVETSRSQPRLFVFGGTDGDFQYLGDIHVLDFGRRPHVGGVPSLFKLALQYVSDHPEEVWPSTVRSGATPASPPPVDLTDACLESVARELLFYASHGGALISL